MKRKILALLLACLMIVSIFPMTILADDHDHTCPGTGEKHTKNNCESEAVETVAPVCGDWGYTRYKCKECGDYFAADFVEPGGGEHVWIIDVPAVAATCTTAGKTVGRHCDKCGAVEASTTVPALEHDWVEDHRDGNCETGGFIYYNCSRCTGTKKVAIETTGRGHTWGTTPDRIEKYPSTTEDGMAVYKCTVCNAEKEVRIDKLPEEVHTHTLVAHEEVAATCTTEGCAAYWECSACGKKFSDAAGTTEITAVPTRPALGHLYETAEKLDYDIILESVHAGCTTKGYVKSECSRCYDIKTREIPAGQHSFDLTGEPTAKKEPTCTEYGYEFYGCTKCTDPNAVYTKRLDKIPHTTFDDATSTDKSVTAADCVTPGAKEWKCGMCGTGLSETIDALGHDAKTITVAANCHTKGYEFTYCTRDICPAAAVKTKVADDGLTYVVSVKDGKLSDAADAVAVHLLTFKLTTADVDTSKHAFSEWEILNDATCTTAGRKFRYCTLCDGTFTETEVIPPKGHNFDLTNGATEVAGTRVDSTCSEAGKVTVKCERCDATEEQTLPKLNHDYALTADQESICGKPAYKEYTCTNCSDVQRVDGATKPEPAKGYYDTEEAAKDIHIGLRDSSTWTVKRDGNCIVVGLYVAVCDECGQNVLIRIDGTGNGHVEGTIIQVYLAPTCTATGHYKIYKCSECIETVMCDGTGKIVSADTDVIPALGHDWTKASASTATCTTGGVKEKWTCGRCGFVDPDHNGAVSEPLGHDWGELQPEKAQTCTEGGRKAYKQCTRCEVYTADDGATTVANLSDLNTPSLGHDMVVTDHRDVTCTLYGYVHHECERCGALDVEYIDNFKKALEHDFSGEPTVMDATCTEDGSKVWNCLHEGCTETKTEVLPKLGHKNAAGETLVDDCMDTPTDRVCATCGVTIGKTHNDMFTKTVDATCKDYGYKIEVCDKCGYSKVYDVDTTYLADHDYVGVVTTEPTITSKGVKTFTCRVCDDSYTEEIPALTGVQYVLSIDNAVKAGAGLAGGSRVAVTVSLKCGQTDVWGIKFDLGYDPEALRYEGYEFVSEKLINGADLQPHDDYVSVVAFAPNSADRKMQNVTIEGEEAVVTIYFTVLPQAGISTGLRFLGDEQTIQIGEEGASAMVHSEGVDAVLDAEALMNVNGDLGVDLADAFALYQRIISGEYDVTADLDRDGEVTLADFKILYTYITGGTNYEEILANMAQ